MSKKIKKSIVGWVAKDVETSEIFSIGDYGHIELDLVYKERGKNVHDWNDPTSWPPKKVRVTVEEV